MGPVYMPVDEISPKIRELLDLATKDKNLAQKYIAILNQLFDAKIECRRAHMQYEIEVHVNENMPDPEGHVERARKGLQSLPPKLVKTAEELMLDSGLPSQGLYQLLQDAEKDGVVRKIDDKYTLTEKGEGLCYTLFEKLPMSLRKHMIESNF